MKIAAIFLYFVSFVTLMMGIFEDEHNAEFVLCGIMILSVAIILTVLKIVLNKKASQGSKNNQSNSEQNKRDM